MVRGRRNTPQGFTLVEVLVTMVVVIIMLVATGSALGIFSGGAMQSDLRRATGELLDQFEFSRARATMRNQAVQVDFDLTNTPQTITISDHPATHCRTGSATVVRTVNFGSAVAGPQGWPAGVVGGPRFPEVALTQMIPNDLQGFCFRPDGRVTRPDGRVIVQTDASSPLASGEGAIEMQMRLMQGKANAITHRVVMPYNGLASVQYEIP